MPIVLAVPPEACALANNLCKLSHGCLFILFAVLGDDWLCVPAFLNGILLLVFGLLLDCLGVLELPNGPAAVPARVAVLQVVQQVVLH
jgi:hypothetical protein